MRLNLKVSVLILGCLTNSFLGLGCQSTTVSQISAADLQTSALAGDTKFQIDLNQPLGFIHESGANPGALGIKRFGLAKDAKFKWYKNDLNLDGEQLQFPTSVKQLYWFATLDISGMSQHQLPRSYTAQWFQPNGKLYAKQTFKSSFWVESYFKTCVKFPSPLPSDLVGRWRIRVKNSGGRLIDDRYFEIVNS